MGRKLFFPGIFSVPYPKNVSLPGNFILFLRHVIVQMATKYASSYNSNRLMYILNVVNFYYIYAVPRGLRVIYVTSGFFVIQVPIFMFPWKN